MFCKEFYIFIHFLTWSRDEIRHLLPHSITFTLVGIIIKCDTKNYKNNSVHCNIQDDVMCFTSRSKIVPIVTILI
jgi:hypothetical protein